MYYYFIIDKLNILDIAKSPYEDISSESSPQMGSKKKSTASKSKPIPVSAKRKGCCCGFRLFTFRRLFLAFIILSFYGASVCPPVDQLAAHADDPDLPPVCSVVGRIPKFDVFQAWYQSRLGPKIERVHNEHIRPAITHATQVYKESVEPHVIELWETEVAPTVVPIYKTTIEPKLQRAGQTWYKRLGPVYETVCSYSTVVYNDYVVPTAATVSHAFTEHVQPQLDAHVWPNYNAYVAPYLQQSAEWLNDRVYEQLGPWMDSAHAYYNKNVAHHVNRITKDATHAYNQHVAPTVSHVYTKYAYPYGKHVYKATTFVVTKHVGPAVRDYALPATKRAWHGAKHIYVHHLHPHVQNLGQKTVDLYNEHAAESLGPYVQLVRDRSYDAIAYAGFVPTQAEIDAEFALRREREEAEARARVEEALRKQRAREEAERKAKEEAEPQS
ncbi:hypothetical protein BDF19DRAFT_131971 [Syncephalis fuscata]|nr:hypothetical protein BDF19DRAFT_131971 [Syncephalis fuscata]